MDYQFQASGNLGFPQMSKYLLELGQKDILSTQGLTCLLQPSGVSHYGRQLEGMNKERTRTKTRLSH